MYYNRTDLSKTIDSAKSSKSKGCMVCHYWFFNHGFKFQDSVCNDCQDLEIMCFNISNIAITTVKWVDYSYIIHDISISEAIPLLKKFCILWLWVYIKCMLKKSMLKTSVDLLFWQFG